MDYKDLTRKLNEFRDKARKENRTFTSSQLYEELEKIGFNTSISKRIAAFMDFEKIGTAKLYSMPAEPIHQSRIERLYKEARKSQYKCRAHKRIANNADMSEKQALEVLAKKGCYRIKRIVGFDLERFAKEQPDIYRKYCKYDYI
jgi:hypothetical protein